MIPLANDMATRLPYITLGVTVGVTTQTVPPYDDGVSASIDVNFPFGSQIQSTVYVCYLNKHYKVTQI